MKNYEKIIINKLIDSYENQTKMPENAEGQKRNVYLRLTMKAFPEYFDTRSTVYDDIHHVANDLEYRGVIKCYWKNNRKDSILEKVGLNIKPGEDTENEQVLKTAYSLVGRTPTTNKEAAYYKLMDNYPNKNQTILNFHAWISQRLREGKSVKKYVDFDNLFELEQILKGIAQIMSNEKECFVREMSMLLYGDSKRLEELRAKMEGIIRDFSQRENESDIFEEFNVFSNPSLVLLKGFGQIEIGEGTIDLLQFKQGLGLCSEDLQNVVFKKDSKVQKIITIENLTTFYRFYEENSLIVYLGGFHNKARRELIQRAVNAYGNAQLFHWGDIDVGGFRIYLDLCRKTMLPFKALHMDTETLARYQTYGKQLTKNDEKSLISLKEFVEVSLCNACNLNPQNSDLMQILNTLNYIRENNIKLEQEIVAYLIKNSE